MSASRQQLHTLVDMVEESGLNTLYDVMMRFVREEEPAADEREAVERGRQEYARGETVNLEDLGL